MKKFLLKIYGGYSDQTQKLDELGVKYTTRDFLGEFWGKEYTVEKPTGKGTSTKIKALYDMGFHYSK